MPTAEQSYSQFKIDREVGYRAEEWLVGFLTSQGLVDARRYDNTNLPYDVTALKDGVEQRYEIKLDRKAYDAFGSCYVEAFNAGKPSGVTTTESTWWVHIVGDQSHPTEALFLRTADVLPLALGHNRLIACGVEPTKSWCFKVPLPAMRAAAKRVVPVEAQL